MNPIAVTPLVVTTTVAVTLSPEALNDVCAEGTEALGDFITGAVGRAVDAITSPISLLTSHAIATSSTAISGGERTDT